MRYNWASRVAQWWRTCLPIQETWVWFLGQEDSLGKEMATHSSVLGWEIPWAEEPGRLQFMEQQGNDPLKWSEVELLSRVRLFATPWTVAQQAPPSMEFSRQEYWSGLPFPSPGDLPDPGIKPWSPALQADALPSEPPGKPSITWKKLSSGN